MVTTRSADKQITTDGKTEELTLRSKPEVNSPSVRRTPSEKTTPSSTKKKARIVVNVPPRKRTRLSYDGSGDTDGPETSLEAVDQSIAAQSKVNASDEIPDSQETISELPATQTSNTEPESTLLEDISTPQTHQTTKRKRKATGSQQLIISSTTVVGSGQHKRFGSEEPEVTDDAVFDAEDNQHETALAMLSDDDDDDDEDAAPEVATTKATKAVDAPRKKRTTRAKKTTREPGTAQTEATTNKQDNTISSQNTGDGEQEQNSTPLPALTLDTKQELDTSLAIGSDDSEDSAFVTARTTRHHDVFVTPPDENRPPQNRFETPPEHLQQRFVDATGAGDSFTDQGLSANHLLLNARPERTEVSPVNRTSLPSKAHNSLEQYRRQKLRNQAEKAAGNRGGRRFKLQDEWDAKRRKFVLGY